MGYSVLYIAFGIVALWLLGEVLLQYKARLRWRLLAFAGFIAVVGGVAVRQVPLILLGALAFGAGQTFVTLSYKRGFSTGWALRGLPGKGAADRDRNAVGTGGPTLAVTPVEEEDSGGFAAAGPGQDVAAGGDDGDPNGPGQPGQVYQPVPLDDSGEYPLYDGRSSYTADPYTSGGYEGYGTQGYEGWGGDQQQAQQPAAAAYENWDQSGWGGQGYGYDQGGYQQPAAADGYGGNAYGGGYGTGGYEGGTYDYGGYGDWAAQQQGGQVPQENHGQGQDQGHSSESYGGGAEQGYGYDPQAQPYIPQQQHQSPYEQPHQQAQQQYGEYDPYDPYRS
ncbi:hypothetical protein [Actinacidiphila acididurans]|uniref:Uncharacterized protein n=1 Tax=Actinacidiphila acididurans TaxID=2784346 RepID=A0ABS2TQ86_9ACTN|nr:hypothetical protein [Actinacidiphila acididurans]MBM9505498.1 hypothetical protein [Actinacidiphila acididurans]